MSIDPGTTPADRGEDDEYGADDAGVPGPGVDAPLFAAPVFEGLDEALRRFAEHSPVVVGLDFDGALAPIVSDPAAARVLPTSAHAIAQLDMIPGVEVAIISGREAEDVAQLADLPAGTRVVGSHGAQQGTIVVDDAGSRVLRVEPVGLTADQEQLHARLREEAESLVRDVEGAWLQVKPTTVVVHTRDVPRADADRVTEAALTGPGALPGVRTMHGKQVVEMSVLEITKGDALQYLREEVGAQATLYAGDDRTDEDAFLVLGGDDVSIKVGEGETDAAFRVADPEGLTAVLMRLVELLTPAD